MPDVTEQMLPDDAARHGIGANNPPSPIEVQRTHLVETYVDLAKRLADLLALEGRLPDEMTDEWEGKITEAVKSCTKFTSNCEASRKEANRPFHDLIAANDGFFKGMSDKVDKLKTKMTREYLTPFQQEKAAAEKRKREEDARIAAEKAAEEDRKRRAEAKRLAEAKAAEDKARRDAEAAEQKRRDDEARRKAEAKAEIERAEAARRAARQAEIDAKKRADDEAAAKAKAEREKAAQDAADAKAKRDRDAVEAKEKADREAAAAAAEIKRKQDERKAQQKAADEARDSAAVAAQRANRAGQDAKAKDAELSRTRTDLGAIASLRTTYDFEIVKEADVPRLYLEVSRGAISAAIRAATHDGKCNLKIEGVHIFPVTDSVVR